MRVLIAVLVLIFSFQSWTKADDIREFQIEGISIGDSLLDYLSEEEIKKKMTFPYGVEEFLTVFYRSPNFSTYYGVQITSSNSENYKIEALEGGNFTNNFNECKKKKSSVEKEIIDLFPDLNVVYQDESKHWADPSGLSKSITTNILFGKSYDEAGVIRVNCTDWSEKIEKEKGWKDNFRVIMNSKKFNIFLINLKNES